MFFCYFLTGQSIGDRQDTSDYTHYYTADIRILCLAVDKVAYQCRERQDKHDGEEPDAHNTRNGIEEHLACDKEFYVLRHDHKLRAYEYEEHLPQHAVPGLFAALGVVVAVSCNAGHHVVEDPEGKECEYLGDMMSAEGSDRSEAPKSVIGKEEPVGDKYESKRRQHHRKRENNSADKLILANANSSFLKVNRELFVISTDGNKSENTAEQRPHTDRQRCALIPDADKGGAQESDNESDKVEGNAQHSTPDALTPIALLCLTLKCGPGRNCFLSLERCEIGEIEHCDSRINNEHKEADNTDSIKQSLELPDLICMLKRGGGIKSSVKEVNAEGYYT